MLVASEVRSTLSTANRCTCVHARRFTREVRLLPLLALRAYRAVVGGAVRKPETSAGPPHLALVHHPKPSAKVLVPRFKLVA